MKHGPIALIDRFMPVVFIATREATYEKVVSNIEEVAARGGSILAITDEGNRELGPPGRGRHRGPEDARRASSRC